MRYTALPVMPAAALNHITITRVMFFFLGRVPAGFPAEQTG
jgi:hypothetical protein